MSRPSALRISVRRKPARNKPTLRPRDDERTSSHVVSELASHANGRPGHGPPPVGLGTAHLLALQRSVGNRAVAGLFAEKGRDHHDGREDRSGEDESVFGAAPSSTADQAPSGGNGGSGAPADEFFAPFPFGLRAASGAATTRRALPTVQRLGETPSGLETLGAPTSVGDVKGRFKDKWGTKENRTEHSKWQAAATHFNIPLDSGHMVSYLALEKGLWPKLFKNKQQREQVLKRAHVLEENMYGGGKLGAAMRNIDTASRILHLIGMIAGILGLVAGICGIWLPAALPVAAIAGIVAMSAHGAMAVLQSILVGHNAIRLKAAKTPDERAKILPTLVRDIAKLCFAIIGVALGGAGAGVDVAGGLTSTAMLGGSELGVHVGMMAGEYGGEALAGGGMFWGIGAANAKEGRLGERGKFDEELRSHDHGEDHSGEEHGGTTESHRTPPPTPETTTTPTTAPEPTTGSITPTTAPEPATQPTPLTTSGPSPGTNPMSAPDLEEVVKDSQDTKTQIAEGVGSTNEMGSLLQSQRDMTKSLDKVTETGPQLDGAMKTLESGDTSQAKPKLDDDPKQAPQNGNEMKKAEEALQKTNTLGELPGEKKDTSEPEKTTSPTSTTETGTTVKSGAPPVQTRHVQRAGLFSRFKSWVKRRVRGLFGRFKNAVAKLKAKMAAIALQLLGVNRLQSEVDTGLLEQQERVTNTKDALTEADAATGDYSAAAGKLSELAKSQK